MDNKKIGKFLRDLRKEQNLTQEELGVKLGATNKTISRWETGTYMPPVDILLQLSKLYDVSINEILSGERLATADYQPKAEENIVTTLKNTSSTTKRSKIVLTIVCLTAFMLLAVFGGFLLKMLLSKPYEPKYDLITVTFNTNGGLEVKPQEFRVYEGMDYEFYPSMPITFKSGYSLSGWYSLDDLQTPWDFEKDAVTQSMTLYAKWEEATDGLTYGKIYDETTDGYAYEVGISKYSTETNVVIPSRYQGRPVVGVRGFRSPCVKSIVLPDSIKKINSFAFSDCKRLTQITIPDSVTTIEDYAFCNCFALTKIVIGSNVTSIGDNAFENCFCLAEVYNKSQLTLEKGSQTFGGVASNAYNVYTSVSGQSKLTYTDDDFVYYSDEQTTLLVKYCGSNSEVILPNKFNGVNYDINQGAFAYNNISKVVVPNGVKNIGQYAFRKCEALQQVSLPDSVVNIGESAFAECKNLQSVVIPKKIVRIEPSTFSGCTSLISVDLPNGLLSIGCDAFFSCEKMQEIVFPDSLESIEQTAFNWCYLKNLTIPKNVKVIGTNAFSPKELQSITVDEENQYFYGEGNCLISKRPHGDCIILGCNNSVIPQNPNITTIASNSFWECIELTSVYISDNITLIGSGAFGRCINLQSLVVSPTNTVYHSYQNCLIETETKTLICMCQNGVIPDDGSVSSIGFRALSFSDGCQIAIPKSVTTIKMMAFLGQGFAKLTINYAGTVKEWKQIEIIESGHKVNGLPRDVDVVICTDGEIKWTGV